MGELYDKYKGKRVVLTSCHNVSYSGELVDKVLVKEREGLIFELDSKTGFAVFCPISAIKDIMEVPLPENQTT